MVEDICEMGGFEVEMTNNESPQIGKCIFKEFKVPTWIRDVYAPKGREYQEFSHRIKPLRALTKECGCQDPKVANTDLP